MSINLEKTREYISCYLRKHTNHKELLSISLHKSGWYKITALGYDYKTQHEIMFTVSALTITHKEEPQKIKYRRSNRKVQILTSEHPYRAEISLGIERDGRIMKVDTRIIKLLEFL
jgi:hypothetical protein